MKSRESQQHKNPPQGGSSGGVEGHAHTGEVGRQRPYGLATKWPVGASLGALSRVSSPAHCDNKGEKMTASYEFEKAMQETLAKQDALIKQMGEALDVSQASHKRIAFNKARQINEALNAYNNWKQERGG